MKIEDAFRTINGYYHIVVRCTCGNGFSHRCSTDNVYCSHCGDTTTVTELMRDWKVNQHADEPHKVSREVGWYCKKCNRAWSQEIKRCPICYDSSPEVDSKATWNCNQCKRVWTQEVKKCPVCEKKRTKRLPKIKANRNYLTWT